MVTALVRKYNPGFLTDDELVASFCVRTTEFELLVKALRECTGSSNPHQIVIGPRGSGKTSLLLRVAAEARRDAALAASFFPVVFAEESYEVATTGEFWLECLTHLAAQAPRCEDDPDLHRTADELRTIRDDRTLADRCLAVLLDFADRHDKRLLLVVENLNALFRDMADAEAGWRLRKVLQTEPRIIVFASATSRFDEIDHPDRALYDLFRLRTLRPLDTDQCAMLWEKVSGRRPPPETIRSLEILTGGSPRLISIVARFGAGLSFRALMAALLDLVDDHTEYFKSHLEALPAQERRVYLALAALWKPATTREIADHARLETSTCSAQLARLGERGVVQVVGGSARRKQYYLTERLYNIYYLLRRRRGPEPLVEAVIRFMESYYSPSELKDIGARMIGDMGGLGAEMRSFYRTALERLAESPRLAEHRDELLAMTPEGFEQVADLRPVRSSVPRKPATGDRAGGRGPSQPHERTIEPAERAARELFETTATLRLQKSPEDTAAACDEVVRRFGDSEIPAVLEWVAKALVNKGLALRKMQMPQAAVAAWNEVVRRGGKNATPALRESIARALVMKGTSLAETRQPQQALAAYDEVVRLFGHNGDPILMDLVAMALDNKGSTLRRLNRTEDALAVWDELERRFSANAQPAVVEQLARALVNKGAALVELARPEDALAVCDSVLHRFGEIETPTSSHYVAANLVNKGAALRGLRRREEALDALDEVVRRFGTSKTPLLVEQVAKALVNRGVVFSESNQPEDALAAYNEVVRCFGASETSVLLGSVAKALVNKGALLAGMSRPQDALAAWGEVVSRFGEIDNLILHEAVAKALVNRGAMLGELSRPHEALIACDEVLRRFGTTETSAVLDLVAKALANKGVALGALNRPEEALAVWEKLARRFGADESASRQVLTERALVENAEIEWKAGRYEAAIKMTSLALDQRGTESAENRWLGLRVRARASLASGNPSACEQDIIASLAILPELESITRDDLDALMTFSIELGPKHMRALIKASPSATLLLPLTTALEQELGMEPRVAQEVEEVAKDIRRDLAILKQSGRSTLSGEAERPAAAHVEKEDS